MSAYSEFFLNSRSSIIQIETLEISHPDFTKTYRVQRNIKEGVTVTLETLEVFLFEYYPLRISSSESRDNLDCSFKIALGDLGETLPAELDAIAVADGFSTKPTVKYRTYRSDALTVPLFGPLLLEVTAIAFSKDGASFEAKAPSLNVNRTGETYQLDRFPMLRGFL